MRDMNHAYKAAMHDAEAVLVPKVTRWGPATDEELAARRDAACAIDGAGCDMPEGGLSADAEWLLEMSKWVK